jgi:hypothetical protein
VQAILTVAENARGVIADSYDDLQGLPVLRAARQRAPVPRATWDSAMRALLQSTEIALLNLSDLLGRSADDVHHLRFEAAATKLTWARGFHRILVRLSLCPSRLGIAPPPQGSVTYLHLADSPALQGYVGALEHFDAEVLEKVMEGRLAAERVIADDSLGSPTYVLLHLARICSHESTIWEEGLAEVPVSVSRTYCDFVAAAILREAVQHPALRGDTFFMQFRGLHQIPETIGEEMNDRIETAIVDLRGGYTRQAIEHLGSARALAEVVDACLPPMVDSLATSDYHRIRENLGLTSGSHSICLRYDLFTHLYQQLWEAVVQRVTGRTLDTCDEDELHRALHDCARDRFHDDTAGEAHALLGHFLALRAFIFNWRAQHLHLPRNNLGGEGTRSLTGSHDAVRAVQQMRDTALAHDPAGRTAQRWCGGASADVPRPVTAYLSSPRALDVYLLGATGHLTQHSFTDVQERTGYFAQRSGFVRPRARLAERQSE